MRYYHAKYGGVVVA